MKKKLHILFLCGWYPSKVFETNGDFIERHAVAVAKKYKVTVFHIVSNPNSKKKLEIISELKNGVQSHIAYINASKNPFLKIYLFLIAFLKLLKKESEFDVVHLNELYPFGIFSLYLKWIQKIPFVITEHSTSYLTNSRFPFFQRQITRLVLKNSARFCPVSYNLGKTIFQKFNIHVPYTIVPNVVNTDLFYPKFETLECFTMLHISSMKNEHKNISGLLKTVSEFSKNYANFKLILLGESSAKYKKEAADLGLTSKIEFMNHIPHEEVPNLINKASIFLLFSNFENLPCVILESFSCGIPVISTDVGGIKEFFPSDFGKLIQPKDTTQLLNALLVFKDISFSNEKKIKMHEFVKNTCGEEQVSRLFDEVYQNALP